MQKDSRPYAIVNAYGEVIQQFYDLSYANKLYNGIRELGAIHNNRHREYVLINKHTEKIVAADENGQEIELGDFIPVIKF